LSSSSALATAFTNSHLTGPCRPSLKSGECVA
jgi:hypothetical protein